MSISAINPSFCGKKSSKVYNGVKKVIQDPTDVHNKDAAVGGAVAAGGVGGAAVVASRLKALRTAAVTGQNVVNRATILNTTNVGILADFAKNLSKFFKETKATAWLARLMETPAAKKIGGAAGGVLAFGVTAAQLYSAGDMSIEAINTYSK